LNYTKDRKRLINTLYRYAVSRLAYVQYQCDERFWNRTRQRRLWTVRESRYDEPCLSTVSASAVATNAEN